MITKSKKFLAAMIIAASISTASACVPTYCQSAAVVSTENTTEYTQYPGTLIYYAGDVTPERYNAVVAAYLNLPENVRITLVANNIYFRIFSETGGKWRYSYSASDGNHVQITDGEYKTPHYGIINQTGQIILYDNGHINLNGYTTASNASRVVSHEVGHAIDSTCLGGVMKNKRTYIASGTDEWAAILNSELSALYGVTKRPWETGTAETFAEACSVYFTNPSALAKSCPQMYAYLNNIITTY